MQSYIKRKCSENTQQQTQTNRMEIYKFDIKCLHSIYNAEFMYSTFQVSKGLWLFYSCDKIGCCKSELLQLRFSQPSIRAE